jgi:hypothetical protein
MFSIARQTMEHCYGRITVTDCHRSGRRQRFNLRRPDNGLVRISNKSAMKRLPKLLVVLFALASITLGDAAFSSRATKRKRSLILPGRDGNHHPH